MWELLNKLLIEIRVVSLQDRPASRPSVSRVEATNKSRKPVSHSTLAFLSGNQTFPRALTALVHTRQLARGLSKSGIINPWPQAGTWEGRLTFVLAWAASANACADSPLTSATWEKWPQGIHSDADSFWLYESLSWWHRMGCELCSQCQSYRVFAWWEILLPPRGDCCCYMGFMRHYLCCSVAETQ